MIMDEVIIYKCENYKKIFKSIIKRKHKCPICNETLIIIKPKFKAEAKN